MEDRHFRFMRNVGMFHHLIEDVPHSLVSIARLMMDTSSSCEGASWWEPFVRHSKTVTIISLTVLLASIVFGLINKTIQLLVLRVGAAPASARGSILMSNINSLRLSFGGSSLRHIGAELSQGLLDDSAPPPDGEGGTNEIGGSE